MGDAGHDDDAAQSFRSFVAATQRRRWLPLCMEVGAEDAVAEAMGYAWQNWDRVRAMANPEGYLYRAAQRYARRTRRHRGVGLPEADSSYEPDVEPGLIDALAALSANQRVAVFVIDGCGCGWTLAEAAALLNVSVSTVRNHRARGMARLREPLEVDIDV